MGARFDRFREGNFYNTLKKYSAVIPGLATTGIGVASNNPAAISAGATMVGAGLSHIGAREANLANAEQAQNQMDFQERMSSTQYQRTRQDMEAAGINPNAIYSLGASGAPSGAQAQMGNEYAQAVHSAVALLQAQADVSKTRAETALTTEMIRKIGQQADISEPTAKLAQMGSSVIDYVYGVPNQLKAMVDRIKYKMLF